MDLDRALETQRLKLLRLLTGWIVILEVLSLCSLGLPLPRWVRAFFETLLLRAEWATQCMVRVSACVTFQQAWDAANDRQRLAPRGDRADDVPTARALLQRMAIVRKMLDDLPGYARRLLRVPTVVGEAFDFRAAVHVCGTRDHAMAINSDWTPPRVERPPDNGERSFGRFNLSSLPILGREAGVL